MTWTISFQTRNGTIDPATIHVVTPGELPQQITVNGSQNPDKSRSLNVTADGLQASVYMPAHPTPAVGVTENPVAP